MQNINLEQVANGFVIRVYTSAPGDETRASMGEITNVYADAAAALAAVTALLTPAPANTSTVSTSAVSV